MTYINIHRGYIGKVQSASNMKYIAQLILTSTLPGIAGSVDMQTVKAA
jgi:hypothetical protein